MVGFSAANFVMRAYAIAAARASRGPGAGLDTAAMRATLAYLDRVLAESPDSGLKPDVLTSCVFYARSLHDDARFNEYFTRLINEYPNSSNAALVKTQFAPNRLLRVGARFPAFRFASLDDSSVAYSNESLAGKPYLIDFWATWCGPCIGEMRYLHAAHDSLGAAVEFLSVSMDQRAEDARAFRRGEWKMPWLHAFVSGVFSNTDMRRMEIMFLPRAILVGGDGTILAVDGDLRGESLLPTIRRALAQATPTP
jgi:thiol-disulfide isomerase/thioredoxin